MCASTHNWLNKQLDSSVQFDNVDASLNVLVQMKQNLSV